MSIKIRFRRMGARNRPFYRLVATDSRVRRDGRFLDILGYYDPIKQPHVFDVKEDRVQYWMEHGAQMSAAARELLREHGTLGRLREKRAGAGGTDKPAAPAESA